jgi:damage-control phosphatase, subfamily I
MNVFLDCLPCSLRQALEAAQMATDDKDAQAEIMDEVIRVLERHREYPNAPAIARDIHRIVKARTGCADPYAEVKRRDLQMALKLLPSITRQVEQRDDRLYWALKAAAAGNAIDSAIGAARDLSRFDAEVFRPFALCDLPVLREKLRTAKSLLLIGDNTGESVFDCLLLKQFPDLKRTYAVRSAPALNDVTEAEARASGIAAYANILSTGCGAPGVLLSECSDAFIEVFCHADVVIAKGQGNYETLSDCPRDLFFLLKAKCPVVACQFGVKLNETVLRHKAPDPNQ